MPYGAILSWNTDRGFGFIGDDQQPKARGVFVHISNVPDGYQPEVGEAIFDYWAEEAGRDGRVKAHNLKPLTPADEECDRVFGYDHF